MNKKINNYLQTILFGITTTYPKSMQEFLNKNGNTQINTMTIQRVPLKASSMMALNIASGFTVNDRMNNSEYDKLFHLRLLLKLNDNKYIYVEKNQTLKIDYVKNLNNEGQEDLIINNVPNISLIELLENGRKILGNKFFLYNAQNNNCQIFIDTLLNGSNINTQEYHNFIVQDVNFIFKNNPYFRKLTNTVSDIGHRGTIMVEGIGIKPPLKYNSPLTNFEIMDICKNLNIKLNKIYMKNEIPETLKNGNYIINLENSGQGGSHWCCFIKKGNIVYYFDPFGAYPVQRLIDICNSKKINIYTIKR
jgi:hypothetical protein